MKPPADMTEMAGALGFDVVGYDECDAGLHGNGSDFVGSHAEVRAFLIAWSQCRQFSTIEIANATQALESGIERSCVSMRSHGPIEPTDIATIVVRPQMPFRGERIAIPDSIAPYFDVLDIRVGNMSTFPQSQNMSAELFACRIDRGAKVSIDADARSPFRVTISEPALVEFGRAWSFPTCQVAQDLVMIVHNNNAARAFEALIIGKTLSGRGPRFAA